MELTEVLGMSRLAPEEHFSPREHREWAIKMWKRMDRDDNEVIGRRELDCEEFRSILRAAIVPERGASTGGTEYQRFEMNVNQAITFCMRKADLNDDQSLSFVEFENFMAALRQGHLARYTSNLIFALFDLNSDGVIDESEFREIYRFYLGHVPKEAEFQLEWGKLDAKGEAKADLNTYTRWLQASENPVFKQHAPPTEEELEAARDPKDASQQRKVAKPLPGGLQKPGSSSLLKSPWNQRLNIKNINPELPQGQRNYFMRHQSLPELKRHFDTHRGFTNHRKAFATPEQRKKSPVLSTDSGISMLPERSKSGGWMKNRDGKQETWQDYWQTPKCMINRVKPGTMTLRCLGPPPKWMMDDFSDNE
jgi:Ca2+-binding EF-hand superfamily protein